jgi:hypothetical protein
MERRDFIKMLGLAGTSAAAYTACSAYMQDALAESTAIDTLLTSAAQCKFGSLKDVEHVIFLMQENRSFDHYYGMLRGVRGFGDPRPLRLKNGDPVFNQPRSPLLSSFSYSFNNVSWEMIEGFIAPYEPAELKRLIKEQIGLMFPALAPALTPHIDTMPDGFILRILRSDWDSLLPKEMAGKTIPELLEGLKSGLLTLTPDDVDPKFAEMVKGGLVFPARQQGRDGLDRKTCSGRRNAQSRYDQVNARIHAGARPRRERGGHARRRYRYKCSESLLAKCCCNPAFA